MGVVGGNRKWILGMGVTADGLIWEGGWGIVDPKITKTSVDRFGNRFIPPVEWKPQKGDIVVVSPGFPPFHPLVELAQKREAILMGDLDYVNYKGFQIWITGTNGKTTTTEMVYYLFKNWFGKGKVEIGGNIGIPVGKLKGWQRDKSPSILPTAFSIPEKESEKPIWVVEVSSFQLYWNKRATPKILAVLPIKQDHLDWHKTLEEYRRIKLSPLKRMDERSIGIIPEEEREIVEGLGGKGTIIYYRSLEELAERFQITPTFPPPFDLDEVIAKGIFKMVTFQKGNLTGYKIASHKLEEFRDKWGRLWVNDSKATNVDATIGAINRYRSVLEEGGRLFLILGGEDKGQEFTPLFQVLSNFTRHLPTTERFTDSFFANQTKDPTNLEQSSTQNLPLKPLQLPVKPLFSIDLSQPIQLILIGSGAKKLAPIANRFKIPYYWAGKLEKGVGFIHTYLTQRDVALLSPACASKDQFKNYRERGDRFIQLVATLSHP